jgi:hypothetical protein
MIAHEENSARVGQTKPEEEALLERSGAPTLRDLRAAAKNLFATIILEADSPLSDLTPANCRRSRPDTNK